jgi:hypothetical protein
MYSSYLHNFNGYYYGIVVPAMPFALLFYILPKNYVKMNIKLQMLYTSSYLVICIKDIPSAGTIS